MTQREIARLAIKVLAVYYGLQAWPQLQAAMSQISGTLAVISQGHSWGWRTFLFQLPIVFFPFVQVAIAVWLWKRASLIAVWISGQHLHDDENEPELSRVPADPNQVQAVVLSSLGVWVMVGLLPEVISMLLNFVVNLLVSPAQAFEYAGRQVSDKIWLWIPQAALGVWLIFGSSGIVELLAKFRRPAMPTENPLY